jgi:hypothetical protein
MSAQTGKAGRHHHPAHHGENAFLLHERHASAFRGPMPRRIDGGTVCGGKKYVPLETVATGSVPT